MKETAFAEKIRTRAGLELGPFGDSAYAPDGRPYVTLQGIGFEDEAAEVFAHFCEGKTGAVSWRVLPEFKPEPKRTGYVFYMRLRVIDTP